MLEHESRCIHVSQMSEMTIIEELIAGPVNKAREKNERERESISSRMVSDSADGFSHDVFPRRPTEHVRFGTLPKNRGRSFKRFGTVPGGAYGKS